MPTSKDSEEPQRRLRNAIERFKSYVGAGKVEEVRKVLSARNISASTMRNWMAEPKKLLTSYRRTEFTDAIGLLPDLEEQKRNNAYEFALNELGVGRDGQRDLGRYDGTYRFFHDFRGVDLNHFVIKVETSPFVVVFVFKYTNGDGHRAKCDGLVISVHGRLVCAGFSPTTVFSAVFRSAGYPESDLIRGMAFIEDLNTRVTSFSTVALTRDTSPERAREAELFVRSSGRSS